MELTKAQIDEFHTNGLLILKDFYAQDTVEAVQKGIYETIGAVMTRHGVSDARPAFDPTNFDAGYMELIGANRAWGGEVYDLVKEIPGFTRLTARPIHEEIMRQLREGALPRQPSGGSGIRVDNPNEDKFRAMWHQEYPAQLKSPDGLVFWSPLVEITEDLGPVSFAPGSHKEGMIPVYFADPENAGRSGAYALKLVGEEILLAKYGQIAPLTKPGDLVILDFLVLHASGYNRSNRPRWTMQFRYYNMAHPTGTAHGWKGSFASGVDFRQVHPELFVETTDA